MKGWIKVHEFFEEDGRELYIRTSEIVALEPDKDDEKGDYTAIFTTSRACHYGIKETVDEVLALIEEAEGESAPQKKNEEAEEESIKTPALYDSLKDIREACKKREDCDDCKYKVYGFCLMKAALGQRPRYWKLKEIKEMFR